MTYQLSVDDRSFNRESRCFAELEQRSSVPIKDPDVSYSIMEDSVENVKAQNSKLSDYTSNI